MPVDIWLLCFRLIALSRGDRNHTVVFKRRPRLAALLRHTMKDRGRERITRRNGFFLPLLAVRRDTSIVVAVTQPALGLKMIESGYGTEDEW